MRSAIREWIEANYQPWRADPARSLYMGRIGSPGAIPLSRTVRSYYERKGASVEGAFLEDLLESELFLVLERIGGWLSEEERRRLDEVAFGLAATYEPNACAMPCLDGHAILIDHSFISMLSSALELYFSALDIFQSRAGPINESNFALALNATVASEFFHVVPSADALVVKPTGDFAYRGQADQALWFLLLFIVAHEAGHILLGHLAHARQRTAVFQLQAGLREAAVLRPAHKQEFDADRFAMKLIFRGADQGGLFNATQDSAVRWLPNYGVLGWMFSLFEVVEILSGRIEMPICDSHPSGGERWKRLEATFQRRALISPKSRGMVQVLREMALVSARSGSLPAVNKELLKRLDKTRALPVDTIKEFLTAEESRVDEWRPPPMAIFEAWFAAPTLEVARKILLEHRGKFLHPLMDKFIYAMALEQADDRVAAQMVMLRLPIIQRCREVGIDIAFEEAATGALPPPCLPDRMFSLSADALQQCERALDAGDRKRCDELAAKSPELDAVMSLNAAVGRLVTAQTPSLAQWILHTHPELMHPIADRFFADTAAAQVSEAARKRVELIRGLAARCREVGLFRAVAELNLR